MNYGEVFVAMKEMKEMMPEEWGMESEFSEEPMGEGRFMLAHAYVPRQCYKRAYCPAEALNRGTLFPELFGVYPVPK